ncbi:hypothetical protein CJU90_2902 [Yarrowia sp. C11]|nr:hypothetical protein CKK34_4349 [Yarrowia sp. E02]KAG5369449.1 hypothetical protein CJU90_2902 [Yarrowia sp. C11]
MSNEFKSTVMPSQEGQQSNVGGPGIQIPKDKEQIESAFGQIRNVDAKQLNEQINKAEESVKSAFDKKE